MKIAGAKHFFDSLFRAALRRACPGSAFGEQLTRARRGLDSEDDGALYRRSARADHQCAEYAAMQLLWSRLDRVEQVVIMVRHGYYAPHQTFVRQVHESDLLPLAPEDDASTRCMAPTKHGPCHNRRMPSSWRCHLEKHQRIQSDPLPYVTARGETYAGPAVPVWKEPRRGGGTSSTVELLKACEPEPVENYASYVRVSERRIPEPSYQDIADIVGAEYGLTLTARQVRSRIKSANEKVTTAPLWSALTEEAA